MMTQDEIDKVVSIMFTADGGCIYCATDLVDQLCKAFPEYRDMIEIAREREEER